jgi:hypothetical protein
VLGSGVGNIGSAQKAFTPELHNSADNLFVYCLVSFGIAGCCVIFGLLLRAWVGMVNGRQPIRYGLMIAVLSGAGVTMSVLESPLLSLGVGLAIGECFSHFRIPSGFRRRTARKRAGAVRLPAPPARATSAIPEHAIDEHR